MPTSLSCDSGRHGDCTIQNCECSCHGHIKPKGIPDFLDSLEKMRELHIRKNQDYASSDNAFSNFEFTEFVLGYFTSDRDKSYVWPIACKMARLGSLLSNDREPNNESIEDSLLDIANYILLWKADIPRRNTTVKPKSDDKGNQQ